MPKLKPGTVVPTAAEDAAITAAALKDPDSRPYTDDEWAKVKPKRARGRPAQDVTKVPVSIRLDIRVVEAFKATGDGWQTRMNEVLTQYVDGNHLLIYKQ